MNLRRDRPSHSRWTTETIASIAARIANGETYQDIGASYGVTRERIRQIAKKHKLGGGYAPIRERRCAYC